jgi:hypothetical protein
MFTLSPKIMGESTTLDTSDSLSRPRIDRQELFHQQVEKMHQMNEQGFQNEQTITKLQDKLASAQEVSHQLQDQFE